jgi:alpha-beta hydrolase superfamily lysophospholipase
MTEERTGTVEGAGSTRIFYRCREVSSPRARLLAVHGLGEHSGRLDRLAESTVAAELDFYALDLRGHGHSQGRRGHALSFDRLLRDLDAFRRSVAPGRATHTFLLGHSLGALIVGRYVQEFGFAGLAGAILAAPFIELSMRPPVWKLRLGVLADRLTPALTLDNELRAENLFRDPEQRLTYDADPLVHHRISVRLWGEMRRNAALLRSRVVQTRIPLLFQIPGDDRVVDSSATRDLVAALGDTGRVREYEGAYHALYHDPDATEALDDVVEWIDTILGWEGSARRDGLV